MLRAALVATVVAQGVRVAQGFSPAIGVAQGVRVAQGFSPAIGVAQGILVAQGFSPASSAARSVSPANPRDLEGVWGFATLTPLERPAEFAGKPQVSD